MLRDLFAQTAVTAAERVRPSGKEMEGLDDATPRQGWAGNMDDEAEEDEHERTVERRVENGRKSKIEPENHEVEGETDEAMSDTKRKSDAKSSEEITNGDAVGQKNLLRPNLKDRFRSLVGRVPEKHRVRAEQEYTSVKEHLKEAFPQERRDHIVWRLKKVKACPCLFLWSLTSPGRHRMPSHGRVPIIHFMAPHHHSHVLLQRPHARDVTRIADQRTIRRRSDPRARCDRVAHSSRKGRWRREFGRYTGCDRRALERCQRRCRDETVVGESRVVYQEGG